MTLRHFAAAFLILLAPFGASAQSKPTTSDQLADSIGRGPLDSRKIPDASALEITGGIIGGANETQTGAKRSAPMEAIPIPYNDLHPAAIAAARQAYAEASPYAERGPHHRKRTRVEYVTKGDGAKASTLPVVHEYTELRNGFHYWSDGKWVESTDEIEITEEGAVARHGQHKMLLRGNLNTSGAVELTDREGGKYRSHILGLSYFDAASGKNLLIAELKDSTGELLPPNQIIYRDAFVDFQADVRYTYTPEGFEQDVILREQPPAPEEFGLPSETSRLEVLTEFLESPIPVKTTLVTKSVSDQARRAQMVAPDLTDDHLSFGPMAMNEGRAFWIDSDENTANTRVVAGTPVVKKWDQLDGRQFLIESVEVPQVMTNLTRLPKAAVRQKPKRQAALGRQLPRIAQSNSPKRRIQLASKTSPRSGYVLDYQTFNTIVNPTFAAGETYYLPTIVNVSGVITFNPGAVIKCAPICYLGIGGSVVGSGAVFTVKNDDLHGEVIDGSWHDTSDRAFAGLYLQGTASLPSSTASSFKAYHCIYGFYTYSGSGSRTFADCEAAFCSYGVYVSGGVANLSHYTTCHVGADYYPPTNDAWATVNLLNPVTVSTSCESWGCVGDAGNSSIANATQVGEDSSTSAAIDCPGDVDYFKVVLSTPKTLHIYTTGSTDTFGTLYTSGGAEVQSNDDTLRSDGTVVSRNFSMVASLGAGTHIIGVRYYTGFSGTGPYTLVVSTTLPATDPPIITKNFNDDHSSVTVAGTAPSGVEVRYTTGDNNPSDPTLDNSTTTPPSVSSSKIVKVRAFKPGFPDSAVVTVPIIKLDPPTFSPSGGIVTSGQSVIVTPPTGARLKAMEVRPNLINPDAWVLTSTGSQPGFNRYGDPLEQAIESKPGPMSDLVKLWATHQDADAGADGGWITDTFPIDKSKSYRFSVWIKKSNTGGTSSPGVTYLGAGAWTGTHEIVPLTMSLTDGDAFPYGYFAGFSGLTLDKWFFFVGDVWAASTTSSPSVTIAYDAKGLPAYGGAGLRWANNSTANLSAHRAMFGGCSDVNVNVQFWNPRVEEITSASDPMNVLFVTPGVPSASKTITFTGSGPKEVQAYSYDDNALRSDIVRQVYADHVDLPSITTSVNASVVTFSASSAQLGVQILCSKNGGAWQPYTSGYQASMSDGTDWKAVFGGYIESAIVRFVGPSVLTPSFSHDQGVVYQNDLVLQVTAPLGGAKLKVKRSNPNLINSDFWMAGGSGSQPGFVRYGDEAENRVDYKYTPYNDLKPVWHSQNDAASDADGGWITDPFGIDKTKAYRFSVWIKKTNASGTSSPGATLFGVGAWSGTHDLAPLSQSSSDDTNTIAPAYNYFSGFTGLPVNQWYLWVGHVLPATTHGSPWAANSVYDLAGIPRYGGTDLRWANNTTANLSAHRALMTSCTDINVNQQYWNPRVEEVSGPSDPLEVMFLSEEASPKTMTISGNVNNEVQAITYYASGLQSGIASRVYRFQVAKPYSTSLVFEGPQMRLTPRTDTQQALIYYTTDGFEPTEGSTPCGDSILVPITATVKLKAFRSNYAPSETRTIFNTLDTDGDGLPDAWEILNFGNLGQGAGGDPDGDGVFNIDEYSAGTNPNAPPFEAELARPRNNAVLP